MTIPTVSHQSPKLSMVCLLAALLSACLAHPAMAVELTDAEKETARQVESLLKQAETNLKLALATAGSGTDPLTGTKAKLTAVRLQPAKAALPAAQERLKKLPADHADVIALQKRSDAASAAMAELQTRIDGKSASATPPDASAPNTMKLDYKQEESFKNAKFVLREIEGHVAGVEKVVADIKPIEDVNRIDHRLVLRAINSIAFVRQRDGYMANHMKNVPDNGAGVAPVAQAWKTAMASIDANEKILAPIHKQLSDLVNPASHPQFESDLKRLGELAGQYGNVEQFTSNRPQAATLVEQESAAREELARVLKAYELLIHQKTDQGERLAKTQTYFNEKLGAFSAAAEAQKKALPGEVRGHIAEANRLAEQAVREEKPAFFTGGIADLLSHADEKLALYGVLSPEEAKSVQSELAQFRLDLKAKQKSLEKAIIAANTLPPDRYTAGDRDKLTALAIETWKKQQPDAAVMTVRIPNEQWARSTLWRYHNKSWYLVDSSKLQAQLIVKHDGDLAVIRPINLYINHLSGDKLSAGSLDDIKDEVIPQRLLPQAKVK